MHTSNPLFIVFGITVIITIITWLGVQTHNQLKSIHCLGSHRHWCLIFFSPAVISCRKNPRRGLWKSRDASGNDEAFFRSIRGEIKERAYLRKMVWEEMMKDKWQLKHSVVINLSRPEGLSPLGSFTVLVYLHLTHTHLLYIYIYKTLYTLYLVI